jgi:hypothetical protein
VAVLSACSGRAEAQSPAALAGSCASAGGDASVCLAAAIAGRSVMGVVGVAAGQGSEVPGTASALGRRIGSPRVALAARGGLARAALPDLSDATGLGESAFWASSLGGSVTLGLFDGFRLMPTVGGFLSLDAFGQVAFVSLPADAGFDGGSAVYTLGARVGILREGFTLPGVSISAARRFAGEVALGSASSDPGAIVVDPSVTSVRATVGKDLFAMELLLGAGWDDYATDATWTVTDGAAGFVTGTGGLDGTRRLLFAGASMTFNSVFTLSIEGGVARGFDPVAGYGGAFDPEAGRPFGSAAFRLII